MNKKFEEALDVILDELLNLNEKEFLDLSDKHRINDYYEKFKKCSELICNILEIKGLINE